MTCIAFYLLLPRVGALDHGCGVTQTPPPNTTLMVASTFLCALPCEVVATALLIKHALRSRPILLSEGNSVALPVLDRLYRDGVTYFAVAILLRLWGSLVWLLCPWSLKSFSDSCNMALRSIVVSRFFLSLRQSIVASSRATGYTTIAWDGFGGTIQLPPNRVEMEESITLSVLHVAQGVALADTPGHVPYSISLPTSSCLEDCRTLSHPSA
ncbi:SubName: Full=Uncharacterized protein {ECO:0000313/EMBL:CCA72115.1} [Serendipita indica DSM 11827]|nr:SubName: Full=Uncharacterized protein {ECO:0000313/EMBL:CCA72115.1} [Serendipita indica DSM 11827]